jgi:hypothetical protein
MYRNGQYSQLIESWSAASGRFAVINHQKKSVSARGRLAETRGGFAGHAARANALLKRRHAASDNKTNFQLSIFPILGLFSQKRSATAAGTCVTCTQRSSTAHAIVPMRRKRKPNTPE